jgi:hypothetical protein
MRKSVGRLAIVGIPGLLAAAQAQTPTPAAATAQFDGTYALISSTTGSYRDNANRLMQCPERTPGAAHHYRESGAL